MAKDSMGWGVEAAGGERVCDSDCEGNSLTPTHHKRSIREEMKVTRSGDCPRLHTEPSVGWDGLSQQRLGVVGYGRVEGSGPANGL